MTGRLYLIEMEVPPEERVAGADSGFPVLAVATRFFWLCAKCSLNMRIRRWTRAGLILEANSRLSGWGAGERLSGSASARKAPDYDTNVLREDVA
jgi:hypothetical protein